MASQIGFMQHSNIVRSPPISQTDEFLADVHVLAVDDSLLDRKVIERLLRTSSYKVTSVDSGNKALEYLGIEGTQNCMQLNINLIITDYSMPGISGYELLKRIKESSAFKEVPVVIMSSENIPNRIKRCLDEGAKEFIMKPVQLSDVERLKIHIRPHLQASVMDQTESNKKRKFHSEDSDVNTRSRLNELAVASDAMFMNGDLLYYFGTIP